MQDEKHPLEGKGLIIVTGDEIGPGKSTLLSSGIRLLTEASIGKNEVVFEYSTLIEYVYDGIKGE